MMKYLQAFLLILVFVSILNGQEIFADYIGDLRPLKSTEADVVKKFGRASAIGSKHFYRTKNATVEVTYTRDCRWNRSGKRTKTNLLKYISFFPVKPMYFNQLGINTSTFTTSPTDADLPSVIAYSDRRAGVAFNVDASAKPELGGTVGRVTIFLGTDSEIMCSDE